MDIPPLPILRLDGRGNGGYTDSQGLLGRENSAGGHMVVEGSPRPLSQNPLLKNGIFAPLTITPATVRAYRRAARWMAGAAVLIAVLSLVGGTRLDIPALRPGFPNGSDERRVGKGGAP